MLIVVAAVATAACLPGTPQATRSGPPGFLVGIWHGWIAPLSLVLGFLNPGIRIYEARNAGWAYDCGFYIAIISGFGWVLPLPSQAEEVAFLRTFCRRRVWGAIGE